MSEEDRSTGKSHESFEEATKNALKSMRPPPGREENTMRYTVKDQWIFGVPKTPHVTEYWVEIQRDPGEAEGG